MPDRDLLAHATEFGFYPAGASFGGKEVHYFAVRVARRSSDLWAVLWMSQCWNHVAERRLPFEEAVRVACSKPDTLRISGKTWADFKANPRTAGKRVPSRSGSG